MTSSFITIYSYSLKNTMTFILSLLIVSSFICKGILSSPVPHIIDVNFETRTNPCENDVERFCKVDSSPTTIEYLNDIRVCLRENQGFITNQCLMFLALDKPSLIESCFPEMKAYCSNLGVDMVRIHDCLSGVLDEELSPDCQEALDISQVIVQEARDPPVRFSWTRFLIQFSQPLSSTKNDNNLRGVTFIEIRTDKGSIFLSDDDNQDYNETDTDDYDEEGDLPEREMLTENLNSL